jgi:DinB family protein
MSAVPQIENDQAVERQLLIRRLRQSLDCFVGSLADVPEELCRVCPSDDRWSVIDCVEHIVIAENAWHVRLQGRQPVIEQIDRAKDEFVNRVADRTEKRSAPERAQPKGRYATLTEATQEFRAARERTIAFAEHTKENFRDFSVEHALGVLDIHQFLLLAAAHAECHAKQIEEIKASAAYRRNQAGIKDSWLT